MLIVPTEKSFDWKHAPIVLLTVVFLNIVVFIFYQSQDSFKAASAIQKYVDSQLIEEEWPIFERYIEKKADKAILTKYQNLYEYDYHWDLAQVILMETGYFDYALKQARNDFSLVAYETWKPQRTEIQDQFNSISSFAYGLRPVEMSVVTLLSHQFLHGGVMHLVGNMVFLVVFGFAVEAAIGHFRFLIFYLIGGMLAGFAHAATDFSSNLPLVGASGAISAVMAMYLAVFRLRKIEFFYWVFFFVGYFRAPALLILPFYIAKEVIQYFSAEGSNIAFMAHAGGFVAGSVMVGIALLFDRNVLNNEYIETDQKIDPIKAKLAAVYKAMETFRFDYALKLVNEIGNGGDNKYSLGLLRYQLESIKKGPSYKKAFCELMQMPQLIASEQQRVSEVWLEAKQATDMLPKDEQVKLAFRFMALQNISAAEDILESLFEQKYAPAELLLLANKMSTRFSEKQDHGKKMKYQEMSQALTQGGYHGLV